MSYLSLGTWWCIFLCRIRFYLVLVTPRLVTHWHILALSTQKISVIISIKRLVQFATLLMSVLCSLQLVLPEYLIHFFFCVMFFCAAEWLTLFLNLPLLAYHGWRWASLHCDQTPKYHISPPANQHFTRARECIVNLSEKRHNFFWNCAAGIWAGQWWAVQDSTTQRPSWTRTSWRTVKKKAGANWLSTCCLSSTISTGTTCFSLLCFHAHNNIRRIPQVVFTPDLFESLGRPVLHNNWVDRNFIPSKS